MTGQSRYDAADKEDKNREEDSALEQIRQLGGFTE